jgi:hypothetical protein
MRRRMRRPQALILLVLVLAGAAIAAGVLAGGQATGTFGPPRRRAHQLLSQLVLPPGAQRLHAAPRGDGGLLRQAQSVPGARQLIDLHRIWRVHRAYSGVTSFVENRLPPDAQGQVRGGAGGPGVPYDNEDDSYSLPTGRGSVFWLDLTFVALPHGWTGVRADALIGSWPCVQF